MCSGKPCSTFAIQIAGQTCLVPVVQPLGRLKVETAVLILMTKKSLGPVGDGTPGLTTGTLGWVRLGLVVGGKSALGSQCPGSWLVTHPVKADERTWPNSYISQA